MQYNPSFAGQVGGPRLSVNTGYDHRKFRYINAPPSSIKEYSLYTAYDQFIPAIRSGIGITAGVGSENQLFNSVTLNNKGISHDQKDRNTYVSVALAPKISLKGKYTLSPSVDISYFSLRSNIAYSSPDSGQIYREFNNLEWQGRAGLLFNTSKLYIGYSVILFQYIRNPYTNTYLTLNSSFQSFLQMGYTFQRSSASKFSFTPQLVLSVHRYVNQRRAPFYIDIEAFILTFRYRQFIWGLNNQGIQLGWQTDKIRLKLTNGFGFSSRRSSNSSYVGNLSFRYILGSKDQKPGRGW
jgi:hypothetical protein